MKRKITRIDPHPTNCPDGENCHKPKRRVAAYARVSTSSEEQLASFEAQKNYYVQYIASNPNWEIAGLYTDEGVTGTSSRRREGFNRLIEDALTGSIDLIVTKSVSRFARNTVDTLTAIRKLKAADMEVFFEKENIYTFDSKGELMLTILSSIAQEESRSISENVKWGCRKRMADGKVTLPYKHFLGFKKGEDGRPEVVEEEAKIIRRIYHLYLEGCTPSNISAILEKEGIPSPGGKPVWQHKTVISILTNEKYMGDALLQKRYTVDFLTKKQKVNRGELPQYYIEQDHEPIVSPEVFQEVKRLMETTSKIPRVNPTHNAFANKIHCGDCGEFYGRKSHSNYRFNKKNLRYVWGCNGKYEQKALCKTPFLHEGAIRFMFNKAVQSFYRDDPSLGEECLQASTSVVRGKGKRKRIQEISEYISTFRDMSPEDIHFDETAWRILVSHADVGRDQLLRICLLNGKTYTYPIPILWHDGRRKDQ